jgi:hypothetical protein
VQQADDSEEGRYRARIYKYYRLYNQWKEQRLSQPQATSQRYRPFAASTAMSLYAAPAYPMCIISGYRQQRSSLVPQHA